MYYVWIVFAYFTFPISWAAGPWQLVFRTCPGASNSNPSEVWLDPTIGQVKPILAYEPCTNTEKSFIVNQWEDKDVEAVRLSLYKGGPQEEQAFITFDGKCSETTSWFADSRIIQSSYYDIRTLEKEQMSHYDLDKGYMFYMLMNNYTDCDDQAGWMVVASTGTCPTWQTGTFPQLFFSNTSTVALFNNNNQMTTADSLGVWVRLKSGEGQRANIAANRAINTPGGAASIDGLTTLSGFPLGYYDPKYCTSIAGQNWMYIDLNETTRVGAVGINQVPASNAFQTIPPPGSDDYDGSSNVLSRKYDMTSNRTIHSVKITLVSDIMKISVRIGYEGDYEKSHANPICNYLETATSPSAIIVCSEPLHGRYIFVIMYESQSATAFDPITDLSDVEIPELEIHVVDSEPSAPPSSAETLCGTYPFDVKMSTIYCMTTLPGQYVIVMAKTGTSLAFCDFRVHKADLHWRHSVIDECLIGADMNVDLAHNVTIIPNPDKPIPRDGLVVKWYYHGNKDNYLSPETATAYLQLWRHVRTSGSQTELMLVGQTEIEITQTGKTSFEIPIDKQLHAQKGDLIGMTMPGPGSLTFYRNTSEIHCILVGDDRPLSHADSSSANFSQVWLDDWTYDVTAELLPEDEDKPWFKFMLDSGCLGTLLEFIECVDDAADPDKSLLWKLDFDGQLINQQNFACLDIDIHNGQYILDLVDCYNVSWGIWKMEGKTLKNLPLALCIHNDSTCGSNGITSCYLGDCATASELNLKPVYVRGSQDFGCYFSDEMTNPTTIPVNTDPIPFCSQHCLSAEQNLSSIMWMESTYTECHCIANSTQYIALPETHCDSMCYNTEPLLNVGRCGGETIIGIQQSFRRSLYLQADLCLFIPGIWMTNTDECITEGVESTQTCNVTCALGYTFSSAMDSINPYDHNAAIVDGSVTITCMEDLSWSLRENQTCEHVQCNITTDISLLPDNNTYGYKDWGLFACNKGYYAIGGDTNRTCLDTGEWTGEPLNCTALHCPDVEQAIGITESTSFTPTSSDVIDKLPNDSGKPFKSQLTYECSSQYRNLSANGVIATCDWQGNWTAEPTECELIDCGAPPVLENTEQTVSSTYHLGNVTYSCVSGHGHTGGGMIRFCTYSGAWNGTGPACTQLLCPQPPQLANTTLQVSSEGTAIGSVVNYTCMAGYKPADPIVIQSSKVCNSNQQWADSGTVISCTLIECIMPPDINFTLVNRTGNKVGDSAVYQPDVGYQFSIGVLKVACSADGKWMTADGTELIDQATFDQLAQITELSCGNPPLVPSTNVAGTGNLYGSSRTYTCSNSMPGSHTIYCQLDETWNTVTIDCEGHCTDPASAIQLGDGVVLGSYTAGTTFKELATLEVICANGYTHASGTGMYSCTTQLQWDDSGKGPRACTAITCEVPPVDISKTCTPPSGNVGINSTLACHCDSTTSMYLQGTTTRTCLPTGLWSGDEYQCQAITCPAVSDVGNLILAPQGSLPGDKVLFLCVVGFKPHPDDVMEMKCQLNGNWSYTVNQYPRCIDPYAPLEAASTDSGNNGGTGTANGTDSTNSTNVVNGTDTGSGTGSYGSDDTIIGSPTSGVDKLDYYGGCPVPTIVLDAFGTVHNISGRFSISYRCMEGFNMSTEELPVLKCFLREWKGPIFECIATVLCPLPDTGTASVLKAPDKEQFSVNTVVSYACNEGFFGTNGDDERTCQSDGAWSGRSLDCEELPCQDPPNVVHASYTIDRYSKGKRVVYKCFPRFKHVAGELEKNCSAVGTWVGKNPVCEESTEPDETSLAVIIANLRANMTDKEKTLEKFGFTEADMTPTSQGIGGFEAAFIVIMVASFIICDIPDYRREIKYRLKPNLASCLPKK